MKPWEQKCGKWTHTNFYPHSESTVFIPLSRVHLIWVFTMIAACLYTYFIVPFSLAFEYEIDAWWLVPIDALTLIIFMIDIPISSRIAMNKILEVTTETKEIMTDYINSRLALDLIAILPIDYLLIAAGASQQVKAYLRILRMLKLIKPYDYVKTIRKHSNL